MSQLQEQSPKMNLDQMDELAAACRALARDMSRLGVSSTLSSQVIASALSNGLNAATIASMHRFLLAQSQTHSAQAVAQGLAQGMPHGQSVQGLDSTTGGGSQDLVAKAARTGQEGRVAVVVEQEAVAAEVNSDVVVQSADPAFPTFLGDFVISSLWRTAPSYR